MFKIISTQLHFNLDRIEPIALVLGAAHRAGFLAAAVKALSRANA